MSRCTCGTKRGAITERCVKCGAAEIRQRFVAARDSYTTSFYYSGDKEPAEHIRFACERCLYGWNQPCLDAVTP